MQQQVRTSRLRATLVGNETPSETFMSVFSETLEEKRLRALASWALKQMGEKQRAYIVAGETKFWLLYISLVVIQNCDPIRALEIAPLNYPDRVRGKIKEFNPHLLLEEHKKYLPLVASNKKKDWRDPKYRREDLAQKLPGATNRELLEYDAEPKAAVVVQNYVIRRYKLNFKWENLKKVTRQARKEKRILDEIIERGKKNTKDYQRLVERIQALD